jgi:hypothetical protein
MKNELDSCPCCETAPPVDLDRLVRLCRFCAKKLDLWMEWKSNHCLYDHATSMPCDECQGANLRNPESIFTVKFRLPNAEADRAAVADTVTPIVGNSGGAQ